MLFSLIYIVLPRAGDFVFDSTVTSAVVRSLFHLLLCKLSPGLACTRQLELLSCAACVWWIEEGVMMLVTELTCVGTSLCSRHCAKSFMGTPSFLLNL